MLEKFDELDKMIEEVKADDTALESLDQFNQFTKYAIENVDKLIEANEKLVDIVKLQDERIDELERMVYGSEYEG